MAQIAISLAPALTVSLTLAGASGASVQLTPPAPVVIAALGEVLRGPQGEEYDPSSLPAATNEMPQEFMALQSAGWVRATVAQLGRWFGVWLVDGGNAQATGADVGGGTASSGGAFAADGGYASSVYREFGG